MKQKTLKSVGATFLGLALATVMSVPASASYTRIVGLGMSNWNVMDGFNVWLNPAWTPSYSNVVIAELGTDTVGALSGTTNTNAGTQWGGFVHNHKDMGSFGIFIRRPYGMTDATGNYGYGTSGYFGPTSRAGMIGNTTIAGAAGLFGVVGADFFLSGSATYGPGDTTGAVLLGGAVGGTAVGGAAASANHAITAPTPANRVDLFWGKKEMFSKDMDFGLAFSWAGGQNSPTYTRAGVSSQATDGTVSTERTMSDMSIGAGIVYRMSGTLPWIEVAVNYGMPSYSAVRTESQLIAAGGSTYHTATGSLKSNGNSAMDIFVRTQINWDANETGLLTFRMVSANANGDTVLKADTDGDGATIDDYDRTGSFKDSVSGWVLDHAKNFKFSDRLNVIFSIGVSSMTIDQSVTNTNNVTGATGTLQNDSFKAEMFNVPVSISAEHTTLDWLTTRFGVSKNVINTSKTTGSDADPTIPTATSNLTFTNARSFYADTALVMNVGAGFSIAKDMGVDAVVRQGILFGGPYWVSGVPNSMFSMLTAWYKF